MLNYPYVIVGWLIPIGVGCTILESKESIPFGSWYKWDDCREGSFVYGFEIKAESYNKWHILRDDDGMTGIRLFCQDLEGSSFHSVTSTFHTEGSWIKTKKCPAGKFMQGYRLRLEGPILLDNTAANDIEVKCSDGSTMRGGGTGWGSFRAWQTCPEDEYFCGVKTKVRPSANVDSVGLVDLKIRCCRWPKFTTTLTPPTTSETSRTTTKTTRVSSPPSTLKTTDQTSTEETTKIQSISTIPQTLIPSIILQKITSSPSLVKDLSPTGPPIPKEDEVSSFSSTRSSSDTTFYEIIFPSNRPSITENKETTSSFEKFDAFSKTLDSQSEEESTRRRVDKEKSPDGKKSTMHPKSTIEPGYERNWTETTIKMITEQRNSATSFQIEESPPMINTITPSSQIVTSSTSTFSQATEIPKSFRSGLIPIPEFEHSNDSSGASNAGRSDQNNRGTTIPHVPNKLPGKRLDLLPDNRDDSTLINKGENGKESNSVRPTVPMLTSSIPRNNREENTERSLRRAITKSPFASEKTDSDSESRNDASTPRGPSFREFDIKYGTPDLNEISTNLLKEDFNASVNEFIKSHLMQEKEQSSNVMMAFSTSLGIVIIIFLVALAMRLRKKIPRTVSARIDNSWKYMVRKKRKKYPKITKVKPYGNLNHIQS